MIATGCSCPVWRDLDGNMRTECFGLCLPSGGPGVPDEDNNARIRRRIREALDDDGA